MEQTFTKYERARIIGARALQIAMNAPLLIKISEEDLEKLHFDAIKIAEVELMSNALPISIKKPFPERKDEGLKRVIVRQPNEAEQEHSEEEEEKEIVEEGEIMAMASPEDEIEETVVGDNEREE
jgi:DNA-directed RNA polymerase subunit K/omega